MADWLYSQFGQTKGPVSEAALIKMILKEELELDDYVMNPKDELWTKIRDIQPLLDKIHEPEKAIRHNVQFGKEFLADGLARVGNQYFYIPISRLVILTILSCGIYPAYWFYKQYTYWSNKHRLTLSPSARSGGMIYNCITLFSKIEMDKELNAVTRAKFNGTLLFWSWVLLGGGLSGVQYSASNNTFLFFLLAIIGWTFGIIFILPIQRYINEVNAKQGNTYDKPGLGHYLCIIAGIVMLIYTINVRQIFQLLQPQSNRQPTEEPVELDYGA